MLKQLAFAAVFAFTLGLFAYNLTHFIKIAALGRPADLKESWGQRIQSLMTEDEEVDGAAHFAPSAPTQPVAATSAMNVAPQSPEQRRARVPSATTSGRSSVAISVIHYKPSWVRT